MDTKHKCLNTVPTHQSWPKKAHKYVANPETNVDLLICGQELLRLTSDIFKWANEEDSK